MSNTSDTILKKIIETKKNYSTRLSLKSCNLTEFPPEILELKHLEELNLSNNYLTVLPEGISKLNRLYLLDLHNNKLTSLPDEIEKLNNLGYLDLSNNNLDTLPEVVCKLKPSILAKMLYINLSNNHLMILPKEIGDIAGAVKLEVHGNPLKEPPVEIANKGIKAIKEYFDSLEKEKKQAINEVKVLLVGDGGAGKTSFVKQIFNMKFDKNESQTHGININDFDFTINNKHVKVHFWDFGGQEIMHATHQFFLSKRSVYILVLDGRKDEKVVYWLKHIQSFGGNSPVLVILNKQDENPGFQVDRRTLQENYPIIKGFFPVSCKTRYGIESFVKVLKKIISEVELIKTTWPQNWFSIKSQLEKMEEPYISYHAYQCLCVDENIADESSQDVLLDFLNDLGVILHFDDFNLLDTHVLEPKWVTEAVYKIINSQFLIEKAGIFELNRLSDILLKKKDSNYLYPIDKHRFIIQLMLKFELCFYIDNFTLLIPGLLSVEKPDFKFDYDNALKLIYYYDFLPKSILHRFIVKMHQNIYNNLRWRSGVVLCDDSFDSCAVVRSDDDEKRIYIYINGSQKRDYYAVIKHHLFEIHNSFEKLIVDERLCLPDNPNVTVSYQHLLKLEKKGIMSYMPENADNEYDVTELLGSVRLENSTEEEILSIL